jgi:hypothetical protein
MAAEAQSVEDILDQLEDAAEGKQAVSVGDILSPFGSRSYGPLLIVPALLGLSPLGGIPGVPTTIAVIVILVASQMALGCRHLWIPRVLSDRCVPVDRLTKAIDKMRPAGRRLDRWFHGRLKTLTDGKAGRVAAGICVLLALAVPPLEFVPFAAAAPMGAIALFGLALLFRDGALMIVAGLAALGAIAAGVSMANAAM